MTSDGVVSPALAVDGLEVAFGRTQVVDKASFEVAAGETIGLVGESGSGKTVTSLAITGLLPYVGGRVMSGSVRVGGDEVVGLTPDQRLRSGRHVSMIFQQPTRSLDPSMTIGAQVADAVRRHARVGRFEAWSRAVELLDRVHIADAARRARHYPHMLSGGMCQRVMIAMALACEPRILIADEPTTALDVTVQKVILDLLAELQAETGVAMLIITHDLGVVARMCDRVAVMYAGQIVETASTDRLLSRPRHPYTAGLLRALPRPGQGRRLSAIPGTVPPMSGLPLGCRFHPRCAHAVAGLCDVDPIVSTTVEGAATRCVRAADIAEELEVAP